MFILKNSLFFSPVIILSPFFIFPGPRAVRSFPQGTHRASSSSFSERRVFRFRIPHAFLPTSLFPFPLPVFLFFPREEDGGGDLEPFHLVFYNTNPIFFALFFPPFVTELLFFPPGRIPFAPLAPLAVSLTFPTYCFTRRQGSFASFLTKLALFFLKTRGDVPPKSPRRSFCKAPPIASHFFFSILLIVVIPLFFFLPDSNQPEQNANFVAMNIVVYSSR